MKKKLQSSISSVLLAIAVVTTLLPTAVAADTYSDIDGHWAKAAIEKWSALGILKGNDGKFRPNDTVTQGELAAILNRIMGFPPCSDDIFTEIKGKWYEPDINALAFQGRYLYLAPVSNNKADGDKAATRAVAAAMIHSVFPITADKSAESRFTDSDLAWVIYRDSIHALSDRGFIHGYSDGSFRPQNSITRAEVVTILDNMISEYITKPGVYDKPLGKNVVVGVPGVELRNQDLYYLVIAPAAGAGKTTVSGGSAEYATYWLGSGTVDSTMSGALPNKNTRWLRYWDSRFDGGFGLLTNPYLISSEAQLRVLPEHLGTHISEHFALTNDISLKSSWTPVGQDEPFWGYLQGKGHAIRGLNVNIQATGTDNKWAGLFGILAGGVDDLTVEGTVTITGDGKGGTGKSNTDSDESNNISTELAVDGELYAGGIAGETRGTISNCVTNVNVTVKNGATVYAGGVTGLARNSALSSIYNCSASGDVSAAAVSAPVKYNYVYAGGVVGFSDAKTVSQCSASGSVTANGPQRVFAGGVIGIINKGTAKDCLGSGNVTSTDSGYLTVGGVIGMASESEISNCTGKGIVLVSGSGDISAGGVAGRLFDSSAENFIGYGDVTAKSTGTLDGQDSVAGGVAGVLSSSSLTRSSSSGRVITDGGHSSFAGGIVGLITSPPEKIKKSTLSQSYATGDVSASGKTFQNNAGGATAQIYLGDVSACWASGNVTVSGTPSLFNAAGSFASGVYNGSKITDCYGTGTAKIIDGAPLLGGFLGSMRGNMTNCYATGSFSGDSSVGYVGTGLVGGYIEPDVAMRQCADLLVNSPDAPMFVDAPDISKPKMDKLTTAQLTLEKTYTDRGWDFASVWMMPTGGTYKLPILRGVGEDVQKALPMPKHLQ